MLGQVVCIDPSRNIILVILTEKDLQLLVDNMFDNL